MDAPTPARAMAPDIATRDGPHAGVSFREFVGMVAAMMALMALGIDTMLPALPDIGRSFAVGDENELQAVVTVFVLGFGLSQLVFGPLTDRFGRRPVMLAGMVGYAVFAIGAVLSTSFPMLLVMRALQGVSIAATRATNVSVVRDCYSGRQMARVMSLAMIVFLAVPILAPSIGQLILLFAPWRGLFVTLAVAGVLVFTWVGLRLPETLHPEFRRSIAPRAIAAAMARTLTQRDAIGYMVGLGLMQGALLAYISSIQQIFADVFHAPREMPTVFAISASGIAVASFVNSRIVERLGMRIVSHAALLGYTGVGLAHLAYLALFPETALSFTLFQIGVMFCFGLVTGNFAAMAMEPLGEVAGTASAMLGFIQMVMGSVLGYAIGQSFDGTTLPLALSLAVSGVLAIATTLWAERGALFVSRSERRAARA